MVNLIVERVLFDGVLCCPSSWSMYSLCPLLLCLVVWFGWFVIETKIYFRRVEYLKSLCLYWRWVLCCNFVPGRNSDWSEAIRKQSFQFWHWFLLCKDWYWSFNMFLRFRNNYFSTDAKLCRAWYWSFRCVYYVS